MTVEKTDSGLYKITPSNQGVPTYIEEEALVELQGFIRDQRDKELGRWRHPDYPDYVAYNRGEYNGVQVVNERNGNARFILRDEVGTRGWYGYIYTVANLYFESHPLIDPLPEKLRQGTTLVVNRNLFVYAQPARDQSWIEITSYGGTMWHTDQSVRWGAEKHGYEILTGGEDAA